MADVLSQSQIDALLKSMGSGGDSAPEETEKEVKKEKAVTEEIKYSKYDFYSEKIYKR